MQIAIENTRKPEKNRILLRLYLSGRLTAGIKLSGKLEFSDFFVGN